MNRAESAQHISVQLPARIGLLSRLLIKQFGEGYSYTEARILSSLAEGPRRIGELAALEGLAQPTTTLLIKRLEEQGLVRRERQAHDQRVVVASLTGPGETALEDLRGVAAAGLRRHLAAMPDEQLGALTTATDALGDLVATLQSDTGRD